ncbi:hypothetical protein HN928_00080, partial [bacterium]|nr:hypothetical protein [bacterium]
DDKNFYRENLALLYVQDPLGFKQHFSEEEYAAFNTALSIDFEKVDKLRVQRQVRSSDLSRNSFYEMALAAKALGSRTVQKLIPNFDRDFEKLTADQRRKVQELEEFVIRQSMPSLAADRNIGVDVLKERKKVLDLVQKGAELLGQEKMPKECEVMKMQKECEAMKKYVSLLVRRVDEGEDARVVLRGLMPDERYQRYTYLLFNLRATQVPDDSDTESVGSLTDSVTSVGSDLIIEDDTDSLSDGEESEEEDLAANWGEALV